MYPGLPCRLPRLGSASRLVDLPNLVRDRTFEMTALERRSTIERIDTTLERQLPGWSVA